MADLGAIGADVGFPVRHEMPGRQIFEPLAYPLPEATATISGDVTDVTGAPVARHLRAVVRLGANAGRTVSTTTSDPVTGAFSMPAIPGVLHDIVAQEDPDNLIYNDKIAARITPSTS